MRSHLTPTFNVTLVAMLRADVDGALWLVDDDHEARFYDRCAHRSGRVLPASSSALAVLEAVRATGVQGVVATVRGLTDETPRDDGVFQPALRDVASLLLVSPVCGDVLRDVAGPEWISLCTKEYGGVLDRAIHIAWSAEQIRLCVRPDIAILEDLAGLIDWSSFQLSEEQIGANYGVEAPRALSALRKSGTALSSLQQLATCDGMNVVEVLAAATERFHPRGLSAAAVVTPLELFGRLRVAFRLDDLVSDEIFWEMKAWHRRNPRYPLLADWRLHDPLGVLWDQRYWEQDLQILLARQHVSVAAYKLDLDNFKQVNERFGHGTGDDAIRLYCTAVQDTLGGFAEVYRRGGDEVVAFAPGLDSGVAEALAEILRKRIEADFKKWPPAQELDDQLTASIGLVHVAPGTAFAEVIVALDDAQNRAKHGGKNRVVAGRCPAISA